MNVSAVESLRLDAMIEEATIDCHDEDEQATGLFTMLEENLALPFETTVLSVVVKVDAVNLRERGHIVAICIRDGIRQAIAIHDLPLPAPPPAGADWIAAYRRWLRSG